MPALLKVEQKYASVLQHEHIKCITVAMRYTQAFNSKSLQAVQPVVTVMSVWRRFVLVDMFVSDTKQPWHVSKVHYHLFTFRIASRHKDSFHMSVCHKRPAIKGFHFVVVVVNLKNLAFVLPVIGEGVKPTLCQHYGVPVSHSVGHVCENWGHTTIVKVLVPQF